MRSSACQGTPTSDIYRGRSGPGARSASGRAIHYNRAHFATAPTATRTAGQRATRGTPGVNDSSIVNYYEKLVFDHIQATLVDTRKIGTLDAILDIACLALNRLPSRYIRHRIDAAFYMTDHERQKMQGDVDVAVRQAYEFVLANPR